MEKKKSVLIVDDNPDMLAPLRTLLELENLEVFTAESGTEALRVLSEIPAPNLILLDVKMDDMTGPEFLIMLEEKRPELVETVPVVFLTGMDEVAPSKAVGFIRKASDIDKFLESVHHFIKTGRHS